MLRLILVLFVLLTPVPAAANFVAQCDFWTIGEKCTLPGEASQPPRGTCVSTGPRVPGPDHTVYFDRQYDWPKCKSPNDDLIAYGFYGVTGLAIIGLAVIGFRRRKARNDQEKR